MKKNKNIIFKEDRRGKKHIFEYERLLSLKYRTEESFMTLQSVE